MKVKKMMFVEKKTRIAIISGPQSISLHPIPPVADGAPEWNIFRLAEAVTGVDIRVLSACEPGQVPKIQAFQTLREYDQIVISRRFLWLYRNFLVHLWPLKLLIRRVARLSDLLSWVYLRRAVSWLRTLQADLVFINGQPQYVRYLRRFVPKGRLFLFVRGEMGESRRHLHLLDGIVVNSQGMVEYVQKLLGAAQVPITMMPNSLGDEFQVPQAPPDRFVRAEKRVVFAGRIVPEKGLLELLDAFDLVVQHLPNVTLTIYGASANHKQAGVLTAYEQQVRARAAHFQPGQVSFAGWVSNREMGSCYVNADLAVFPSVCKESFGMVALEAMRCGAPVVAATSPGFNELVLPELTGYLIDVADNAALADKMLRILKDPALASQMGHAGYQRSLLYTPLVAAHEFEQIVKNHLSADGLTHAS